MATTRQLAAIMFTDIVGYTAMMGSNELRALEILRESRKIQKEAVEKYGGEWLKEMGDGVLAKFDSALHAVQCSLEIQKSAQDLDAKIRIGLHLGDVSIEEGDVFGDGVNIASRIQAIADPGGIYVSESVVQALRGISDFKPGSLGQVSLKNVTKPINVYFLKDDFLPAPDRKKLKQLNEKQDQNAWRPAILLAVIITVLGLATIIWATLQDQGIRSIAVLPVENVSGNEEIDYFASGIHDALINELGKISELRVPSRTSMMRYSESEKSLLEIAKEMGVDGVIEASLYSADENVQIRVNLISAKKEEDRIWSEDITRSMEDILFVYEDVAKTVAEKVNLTLSPKEKIQLNRAKTVNPEAYKTYLKGMSHWDRLTRQDLNLALNYFERAIDIDSNFAPAYAGIASVWGGRMQQGIVSRDSANEGARIAVEKALELDSSSTEVLAYLATSNTWWNWRFSKAGPYYERALDIAPGDSRLRAYYSHYLFIVGRKSQAIREMERSIEGDPFNPLIRALWGMSLNFSDEYETAVAKLTDVLQSAPQDRVALSALRTTYHLLDMHNEAIDIWKRAYEARGDSEAAELVESTYQKAGYDKAMEALAQLLIDRSADSFVPAWQIATLYTRASNSKQALDWLEKAYKEHDPNFPYISCDPIFDFLREEKQFKILIQKMNYPK